MKFGIQTARLTGETIDEKFASARRIGFDAVEVNVGPTFELGEQISAGQARQRCIGHPCLRDLHPFDP